MKSISLSLFLCLFLFFTSSFFFVQISAKKCHLDDENALLSFKSRITSDPKNKLSNWLPGTNCCYWYGIECNAAKHPRVKSLSLQYDNIVSDTIPPSLSKLVFLESLTFSHLKSLSGQFPEFLASLPKLKELTITFCNLSGPLSDKIGSFTSLVSLSLYGNKFSGSLPNNFDSLTHLTYLSLANNKFSGRIPSSITKLTSLTTLELYSNLIRGTIPKEIGTLKNLTSLNLQRNLLSGAIPDSFTSLTQLSDIDLSYNKLHGPIPPSFSSLAESLSSLKLSHNALTGNIPNFFGKLINLHILDLSWNHFTGALPSSLSNISSLSFFDLSHNSFVNPLPKINTRNSDYVIIDLSYNLFNLGSIPEWITSLEQPYGTGLAKCGIKMNLDDWKPENLGTYITMDISENEISGSPVSLLNQTHDMVIFKASGNQLKFDLGNLKIGPSVRELDLSRNMIFGKVPKSVAGVKKLNLSHNDKLCGSPLPPCKE